MHVEKNYETLGEELKVKICRDVFMNHEEECSEAEDIRKEVDSGFALDIREENFAESEEESESE